ncbi:MAG TPA: phosphate ABC transporter ATP-binding protein [Acidobacteriota bacterium]|nr:phosphate ABC transporter ATP-binding protein [Acidobacteriota bacterium]
MTPPGPVLTLQKVSRRVGPPEDGREIVSDVSCDIERGGIYTVLGPSGAGKSSLLRLINRLDEPTGGEITFEGKAQRDYSPCELRRKIGYLFQTPHLFPETVTDNLRFAQADLSEDQLRVLIEQVHLKADMLARSGESLSVGEKQRVALARLLATGPTVVLLDEPTSALDPSYTAGIEDLIKELVSKGGLTVIMVTHHPEQALRMGGESLFLVAGRLVESGPADQVVNHPQTELGRRYKNRDLK